VGRESADLRRGGGLGERFSVVPRHPAIGDGGQLVRVTFKLCQVVEWACPAPRAGVDQAHKQVADMHAAACLIEEGVLAMPEDGALQRRFAEIVRQGRLSCSAASTFSEREREEEAEGEEDDADEEGIGGSVGGAAIFECRDDLWADDAACRPGGEDQSIGGRHAAGAEDVLDQRGHRAESAAVA
jgi:hypothetical protein